MDNGTYNDYDKFAKARQEAFLAGTSKPHRFVEKPMMRSMLPDLTGKRVLMLGCGTGEESVLLGEFGGVNLVGVDLSEKSIEIARESYPEYEFLVGDMHALPFSDGEFDFIYSSLTVHYSERPKDVYLEVYRVLKDGGRVLFSVAHPIRWASTDVELGGKPLRITGHTKRYDGAQIVYGEYQTFAKHEHTFSDTNSLAFYVGPPSMHFKLLRECGFAVDDFTESKCVEECRGYDEDYFARYSELPQFVAFLVRK